MDVPRRSLLRLGAGALVGLLAGCTAPDAGEGTPTSTTTPDGTPVPTADAPTRTGTDAAPGDAAATTLSLAAVDDPPALPVRPTVAVVAPTATADHPPRLRVTVTNRSDGTVTVGEGRAIVFAYVTGRSGGVTLLPRGGDYPVEPGCWRLQEPIAITQEYRTVTLAPDESVSEVVGVYGAADGDGCLPTGTFRVESTYRVTAGETPGAAEEHATWGFSLRLA